MMERLCGEVSAHFLTSLGRIRRKFAHLPALRILHLAVFVSEK